jgi:hypothetical protein
MLYSIYRSTHKGKFQPQTTAMNPCLFCKQLAYKTDADRICGSCVQLFLNAAQEDLKQRATANIKNGKGGHPDWDRPSKNGCVG